MDARDGQHASELWDCIRIFTAVFGDLFHVSLGPLVDIPLFGPLSVITADRSAEAQIDHFPTMGDSPVRWTMYTYSHIESLR